MATAGGVRSPRFRRDPFIRDVASDPGRATVPRVTAPHMLPSAVATASAPATSRISWLNPTPQMITVYASPWSSPSPTQHSLPGGRYPLPGPDFHRLDRASFAWRTATPSSQWTLTTYSLPVSRRTHSRCGLHTRTVTVCRDRYPKASDTSSPPCLLRSLPAGAVAGWGLHPLEKRRLVTAHVDSGPSALLPCATARDGPTGPVEPAGSIVSGLSSDQRREALTVADNPRSRKSGFLPCPRQVNAAR